MLAVELGREAADPIAVPLLLFWEFAERHDSECCWLRAVWYDCCSEMIWEGEEDDGTEGTDTELLDWGRRSRTRRGRGAAAESLEPKFWLMVVTGVWREAGNMSTDRRVWGTMTLDSALDSPAKQGKQLPPSDWSSSGRSLISGGKTIFVW